jgi:CO/xanthine dehydrogenase Mo-binding subunit
MAIGQSVPMVDARERVTGRVPYALNLEPPGTRVGLVLRSQRPHARPRVDASRARRLPGVVVLTGQEILSHGRFKPCFGSVLRDQPILAFDKVRFSGEPIAALAAADPDAARAALDLIEVEYDDLPAVYDARQALQPDAPVLHDQHPDRANGFADLVINRDGPPNLLNHFKLRKGDIERGFADSDLVLEHTFSSPAVQHVPFEPHVVLAHFDAGRLTVWSSTQTPHVVRAALADVFGLPLSQVRVIVSTLGGGYGAKCYPKLEPLAAALALAVGRPVKLVPSRAEEFVTITKHGMAITMKTGVKRDGTLVARQVTCHFNAGAYADISPRLIRNGGFGAVGPYRIPHVRVDSYAVYTNCVPAGAFRGYGVSQGAWAYESQMDLIAAELGLDPLELRLRNALRDGDRFATGEELHDLHYERLLREAAEAVSWEEEPAPAPPGKRRAKAITCVIKGTVTPSTSTAAAKLNEDGSLSVLTSSVEMGQGAKTTLAQIAAHEAALPIDQVQVSEPDTDTTPYDQTTSSSRTTFSMGTAVRLAVREITRQLRELAAERLEAAPGDLLLEQGKVSVRGAPERSIAYAELIRAARLGNLLGNGTFVTEGGLDPETGQGIGSAHWHQAAAACEVEVDLETGKIDVLRFHGNVFAGRMVNPRHCELQTEGSTLFGLGQALFEELRYEDGRLATANLSDYMIPSIEDLPSRLSVGILEQDGDAELHGIGETSLPPVMPAIANAVARATGARLLDLPLTPERVLAALRRVSTAPRSSTGSTSSTLSTRSTSSTSPVEAPRASSSP